MWGDMLSGRADLAGPLPDGVTVCEWGYDDWYPFDERCAVLAEAGVPFWVAPGHLELDEHPRTGHQRPHHVPTCGRGRPGPRSHRLPQHRLG